MIKKLKVLKETCETVLGECDKCPINKTCKKLEHAFGLELEAMIPAYWDLEVIEAIFKEKNKGH